MKKIILSIMFLSFLVLGAAPVATAQKAEKKQKTEQTAVKSDCSKDCQHKHQTNVAPTEKKACCSDAKATPTAEKKACCSEAKTANGTDKKACTGNHAECKSQANKKGECCSQKAAPEVKKDAEKK